LYGTVAPPRCPPTDLDVTSDPFARVFGANALVLTPTDNARHTGVKYTSLAPNPEAEWLDMTRTIPRSLAPVLEQPELYQADLATTARLDDLIRAAGIHTATRTVATRLRERGWLLPTGQRGVWEGEVGHAKEQVGASLVAQCERALLEHCGSFSVDNSVSARAGV
jgi:Transcriptional regulator, AbiEi antitoxin